MIFSAPSLGGWHDKVVTGGVSHRNDATPSDPPNGGPPPSKREASNVILMQFASES